MLLYFFKMFDLVGVGVKFEINKTQEIKLTQKIKWNEQE